MAIRSAPRMMLSVAYLALLFTGAGLLYYRLQAFEGEVFVGRRPERLVVRPSGAGLSLPRAERKLPAELMPFANKGPALKHFQGRGLFDAAPLEFTIHLAGVEILEERPPREELEVFEGAKRRRIPVRAGDAFNVGPYELTMERVRPWAGLVRMEPGRPMANVALRRGTEAWAESIFLAAGKWHIWEETTALCFRWAKNEGLARSRFPERMEAADFARWGVVEGDTAHWFEGLQPGTGVVLDDGTDVTLLRFVADRKGKGPAILVSLKRGAEEERAWVAANAVAHPRLRFTSVAYLPRVILFNGWRDGAVHGAVFEGGQRIAVRRLEEGKTWVLDGAMRFALRLDQVMSSAGPVAAADGDVFELPVSTRQSSLALREGLVVPWEGFRLAYRRIPRPPLARYALAIHEAGGGAAKTITLEPGEKRRYGAWLLSLEPDFAQARTAALVHAERSMGGPVRVAGLLLFVVASFALVVVRFRPAKSSTRDLG